MKRALLILMLLAFWPLLARATPIGVRAQSFGGAIRAQASSNDVIFFNPAGMIKHRRIGGEIDYLHAMSSREHRIGASLIDSESGAWALGLAYSGLVRDEKAASHLAYVAMAMPIVSDMFSIGASANYCHDPALGPSAEENFFNFDVGFLANLPEGLAFAMTADHLLSPKGDEKSMGLSIGSAFDLGALLYEVPLSFSFDWLMDDVTSEKELDHIFGAGMQYLMFHTMPLRVGFKASVKENDKLLSLGSGFLTSSLAVDGLYQQDISVGKNRFFGVALRLAL